MSRQRKYIICKDWSGKNTQIRIGYPFFHRDLIERSDEKNHIKCVGGGKWDIDTSNKTITLYGASDDFGKPKKNDIEQAIKNLDKHAWWQMSWMIKQVCGIDIKENELSTYRFVIDYF